MSSPPRPHEDPTAADRARARLVWAHVEPLTDQQIAGLRARVEGERYTRFLGPNPYTLDDFQHGYAYDAQTAAYLADAANRVPALLAEVDGYRAQGTAGRIINSLRPDEAATIYALIEGGRGMILGPGVIIERIDPVDTTLSIGKMVHYVLGANSQHPGECRPALVVRVWDSAAGTCNLMVFPDGSNDYADLAAASAAPVWATSVRHADHPGGTTEPVDPVLWSTWHWPADE